MNNFFKSVHGAELGKTPARRSLSPGKTLYLFAGVSKDFIIASTETLSNAGTPGKNSLRPSLHIHDLPFNEELGCVPTRSPASYQ